MASTVNNFQTRRAAYTASRGDGESGWKSFVHNLMGAEPKPDPWNEIESQRGMEDSEAESPHPHSPTMLDKDHDGSPGSSRERETANGTILTGSQQPSILGAGEEGPDRIRRRITNKDRQPTLRPGPEQAAALGGKQRKQRTFFKHIEPKEPFTVRNQIQRTLFGSWINILLIAAPVGIVINYIHSVNRVAVFIVNFIAIVPLAAMLSFATEEIALRTGETLGGLLNATFGYVDHKHRVDIASVFANMLFLIATLSSS